MSEENSKCHFCKEKLPANGKTEMLQLPRPDNALMLDIFWFCKCKGCLNQYKGSEQQKQDETERLKAIDKHIKELEPKAKPGNQVEEALKEWKKEAKEIRQKWNIAKLENNPQQNNPSNPHNKSNKGFYIGIAILAGLSVIGVTAYFFLRNKNKKDYN